jgi:P27 family predicted phage terminase small subunit
MNPKKPTSLKLLHGTFRKDRAPKSEPQPRGAAVCPSWLDATAKQEWKRVAPELARLGLLTKLDSTALAAYCVSFSTWKQAQANMATNGLLITTARGTQQKNPAVSIAADSLKLMKGYLALFGLSPSDRSRLSATPMEEPTQDDFTA